AHPPAYVRNLDGPGRRPATSHRRLAWALEHADDRAVRSPFPHAPARCQAGHGSTGLTGMEVRSPPPARKCTARAIIERRNRAWKPYTVSIWVRGQWIGSQGFWRHADCDVIRQIIGKPWIGGTNATASTLLVLGNRRSRKRSLRTSNPPDMSLLQPVATDARAFG